MSLKLINISKNFKKKIILNGFSYEFSETGIYALIGNSGAGKTTLLRIISGLDTDYSGEVIGGGIANTAFAFQEYRLFPQLSAIDNAVAANGEIGNVRLAEKAKDLLLRLGFNNDDLSLLPFELSGGMRQRVSLARAILRDAPVLLLDEPTKELDEGIRSSLYEIIKEESKQRLVIIVSHHNEDFEFTDAEKIYI
ncbi:MAG: ATP-binding cassette domain-containing protein [Ruminococcaceae bacterium]|nr:ATP-binding cassette domain-containing protein [Oscillospiraceae bacterium]